MARVDVDELETKVERLQRQCDELRASLDKAVQRVRSIEIKLMASEEEE